MGGFFLAAPFPKNSSGGEQVSERASEAPTRTPLWRVIIPICLRQRSFLTSGQLKRAKASLQEPAGVIERGRRGRGGGGAGPRGGGMVGGANNLIMRRQPRGIVGAAGLTTEVGGVFGGNTPTSCAVPLPHHYLK